MADGNAPGPAADASGNPVFDPSKNVFALVDAAMRRQDDLRKANERRQDDLRKSEAKHVRREAELRHKYESELRKAESERVNDLRKAETDRIDAIRQVDVGNVQRAAEVQAQLAETLRTQVAATASAAATALATALGPIQKSIADIQQAQFTAQGQSSEPSPQARDIEDLKRLVYDSLQARVTTREVSTDQRAVTANRISGNALIISAAIAVIGIIVAIYLARH